MNSPTMLCHEACPVHQDAPAGASHIQRTNSNEKGLGWPGHAEVGIRTSVLAVAVGERLHEVLEGGIRRTQLVDHDLFQQVGARWWSSCTPGDMLRLAGCGEHVHAAFRGVLVASADEHRQTLLPAEQSLTWCPLSSMRKVTHLFCTRTHIYM
jgi:hypothetical protein